MWGGVGRRRKCKLGEGTKGPGQQRTEFPSSPVQTQCGVGVGKGGKGVQEGRGKGGRWGKKLGHKGEGWGNLSQVGKGKSTGQECLQAGKLE